MLPAPVAWSPVVGWKAAASGAPSVAGQAVPGRRHHPRHSRRPLVAATGRAWDGMATTAAPARSLLQASARSVIVCRRTRRVSSVHPVRRSASRGWAFRGRAFRGRAFRSSASNRPVASDAVGRRVVDRPACAPAAYRGGLRRRCLCRHCGLAAATPFRLCVWTRPCCRHRRRRLPSRGPERPGRPRNRHRPSTVRIPRSGGRPRRCAHANPLQYHPSRASAHVRPRADCCIGTDPRFAGDGNGYTAGTRPHRTGGQR